MIHYLNVTKQDIYRGTQNDPHWCPISLAAKRYFGRMCAVGNETCRIEGTARFFYLDIPIREFIRAYDKYGRGVVQPMEFTVFKGDDIEEYFGHIPFIRRELVNE